MSGVDPLHLTPWYTSADMLKTTTVGRERELRVGITSIVCLTSRKLSVMSWEKTGTQIQNIFLVSFGLDLYSNNFNVHGLSFKTTVILAVLHFHRLTGFL